MSGKSEYPKVLVAMPTYEGKDYMFNQCTNAIRSFTYPNFDWMIIDNTEKLSYYLKMKRRGFKNVYHVERGGNSRQALCNAQNLARTRMLEEGYDYLLFVESDLEPPVDVIQRLIARNVPIVGVFYLLGVGEHKRPCIFVKQFKENVLAMGTRLITPDEVPKYLNNGLQRVHGTGLGCTLIRRDIMQSHVFWHDERFSDKHSDVYFFMQMDNEGIPVYVDTNVQVTHNPSDWNLVKDK